jgi:uncharacterized membrane protein
VFGLTKKLVLALAIVAAIGAIFLAATGQIGILRWGLVAAACLLLPGLGWARRSQLRDAGDRLALAIGISISAVTVIGTIMAITGLWSASVGMIVLLAVAVGGFLTKSVLNAIHTGLKWFINLFVGPESPATQETSR